MTKTKKWSEPKKKKVGRPKGKGKYYEVTGITPSGERYKLGYTSSKSAFIRNSKDWTTKGFNLEFKTLYRKEKSKKKN